MAASILDSTKKKLGLGVDDDSFDVDVIAQINGAFFTLQQLGVGPLPGFVIEGSDETWDDYVPVPENQLSAVQVYVYNKARLGFDPPTTSYALTALENQIRELEWRLNTNREATDWVDPTPVVVVEAP